MYVFPYCDLEGLLYYILLCNKLSYTHPDCTAADAAAAAVCVCVFHWYRLTAVCV
jgi:hypothetical protein